MFKKNTGIKSFSLFLTFFVIGCSSQNNPENQNVYYQMANAAEAKATRFKATERIIAIGDVHGDFQATKKALQIAGLINNNLRWTGGKTVVVQTGDQLDRGDQEKEIIDLFEKLRTEAKASGGAFHILNGNHEIMNVALDLRYVTEGGYKEFQSLKNIDLKNPMLANVSDFMKARVAAFLPGGPYAKILAKRDTILIVGDILFTHGGLLPKYAKYGIDRINHEVQDWMSGRSKKVPASVNAEDGPVWSRNFSDNTTDQDCNLLEESLKITGTKYMVVGHTPQQKGITSRCDGKAWNIDVGMAKAYGGPVQVLEIKDGKFKVLK